MSGIRWARKPKANRYTITEQLSNITWSEKGPQQSLEDVYGIIDKLIVLEAEWYGKHLWRQRLGARLIQIVTVALLFVGVLLPIVSAALIAQNPTPDWAKAYTVGQIGYAALLIAALLLLLDQVFQFSSSWVRFLSTELRLFAQLLQTRFLWLSLQAAWGDEAPDHEKAQKALDLLKDQAIEVNKIVQSETDTWAAELQKGYEALRSRIDTATSTAEAQVEAAQTGMVSASDSGTATISVSVEGVPAEQQLQVVLRSTSLLSEAQRTLVPPSNVVFEGLRSGKYVVSVGSSVQQTGTRQEVVNLAKDEDKLVSINFEA